VPGQVSTPETDAEPCPSAYPPLNPCAETATETIQGRAGAPRRGAPREPGARPGALHARDGVPCGGGPGRAPV